MWTMYAALPCSMAAMHGKVQGFHNRTSTNCSAECCPLHLLYVLIHPLAVVVTPRVCSACPQGGGGPGPGSVDRVDEVLRLVLNSLAGVNILNKQVDVSLNALCKVMQTPTTPAEGSIIDLLRRYSMHDWAGHPCPCYTICGLRGLTGSNTM